jgi:hypothetical protein
MSMMDRGLMALTGTVPESFNTGAVEPPAIKPWMVAAGAVAGVVGLAVSLKGAQRDAVGKYVYKYDYYMKELERGRSDSDLLCAASARHPDWPEWERRALVADAKAALPHLKSVMSAHARDGLVGLQEICRGMRLTPDRLAELLAAKDLFTDSTTSFTRSDVVADEFAGTGDGQCGVMLRVSHPRTGVSIDDVCEGFNEQEVLVPSGVRFVVKAVNGDRDRVVVELEEGCSQWT